MWWLVCAFFAGAFIGVIFMCLAVAAGDAEREREAAERYMAERD